MLLGWQSEVVGSLLKELDQCDTDQNISQNLRLRI